MRKHMKKLTPTLWLVIAAFIIAIFAVWGGAGRLGEANRTHTLASAGKDKIMADFYQRTLVDRLEALKREYKEINKSFVQQLGIPQQVLEQMIDQRLLLQLAGEMGIICSDEELRARIVSFPVFQRDGKFIGFEEYRRILEWNRISLAEFEEGLKKEIIINKLIQVLTAGIAVTEEEVLESYKKDNETAKVEYIVLNKNKIEEEIKLEQNDLQEYFETNKEKYELPERREASLVFLKVDDLKKEIQVTDQEIEKYYNEHLDQFKNPERIRVSRIYLPFSEKDKPQVQAEAQSILERARSGEDFSELARKYSKDDKAKDGGDWGIFDWKTLTSKEQEEIRKLPLNEISSLVETDSGFAILKVTLKEPETTTLLAEAKTRIKSSLEEQKARDLGQERIAKFEKTAKRERRLDVAAEKMGFKVRKTGLLKKGAAIEDIDPSGFISQAIFNLKEKEISSPIQTFDGIGLAQLEKIEAPRPAQFDEVKEQVEKDFVDHKKKELALRKIKEIRARLVEENWEEIAKNEELEYQTINEHKRQQYIGIIGENEEFDRLAFSLPLNEVSEPVAFENGYALLRVLERKAFNPEDYEKNKNTVRENILETKKNKFLQSYLSKLREEKKVKVNYNLFLEINSDVLSRFEELP